MYTSPYDTRVGTVRLNTEHAMARKPLWMIVLKLLGVTGLVAYGMVLLVPNLPFPQWQSVTITLGVIMLYSGFAFFVRPEPNTDNLAQRSLERSDDWNRVLMQCDMLLCPGRFVAATFLDLCAYCQVEPAEVTDEVDAPAEDFQAVAVAEDSEPDYTFGGAVELSSARYLQRQS